MVHLTFSEACSLLLWYGAAPFLLGYAAGRLLALLLTRRRRPRRWQWKPPPAPAGEGRRPTFTLPCDDEDIA